MLKKIKTQARPGVAVHSGNTTLRLLLASSLLAAPLAQSATDNTLTVTAESQESVTGRNSGIVAKESASGTKTPTPLRKTPQSISVVTREQMDDQAAASVSDALSYTSGVVTNYRVTPTVTTKLSAVASATRQNCWMVCTLVFPAPVGEPGRLTRGCWSAWRWSTARQGCYTARSARVAW